MSLSSQLRSLFAWALGGLAAVVVLLAGAQPAGATTEEHVYARGDAVFHGSSGDTGLAKSVTGMSRTPSGDGYSLVTGSGRVLPFGGAAFYGDMSATYLNSRIVDIAITPSGKGYWFVAADGGIFSFGDSQFFGSMGGQPLGGPIVAIEPTSDGRGYWLAGADGAVYSFGAAVGHGSAAGTPLAAPIVDMDAKADDSGYWLLGADGQVFNFGTAGAHGAPSVAAAAIGSTATGAGYWVAGVDGSLHEYGDAVALDDVAATRPIVAMAVTPSGAGLWLASEGIGPGAVAGTIVDDLGAPAPDVCVTVSATSQPWFWAVATTAADGSYHVGEVPPGEHSMYAYACNGMDYHSAYLPNVVVSGGETTVANGSLRRTSKISGAVTDTEGNGIDGVCVTAFDEASFMRYEVRASVTGAYRIASMEASDYSVRFAPCDPSTDWEIEWWNDKPSQDLADRVTLATGEERSDIDAALSQGAAISGVVTVDGQPPLGYVCVAAHDPSGAEVTMQYAGVTGYYRLTGLAADDYKVHFRQCEGEPHRAPEWWDNQSTKAAANPITTTRGATVEGIDAELDPGGFISGHVTDELGRDAEGACIEARDVDSGYASFATTSVTGTYTIPGLATSSYTVYAHDCGYGIYGEEWFNEKATAAEADPVAATAGGTVTGIDFSLAGAGGAIAGVITDSVGNPLANVCVAAIDAEGGWRRSSWTAADGSYRLSPMTAGEYRLFLMDCGSHGYASEYYEDQSTLEAATPVTVTAGSETIVNDDFGVLSPPEAPQYVWASAGDQAATVSWAAPWRNGGRPVIDYTVTLHPTETTFTTTDTTLTVDGLTNGQTYNFSVQARNEVGPGEAATSNTVTPGAVPGAPTDVSAQARYESAVISWTPPVDNGSGVQHYLVTGSDGTEFVALESPIHMGGLVNGQTYTFTVKAWNQFGYGPESAPSNPVTPADAPGPPENVVATPGDSSATVSWTAPGYDGGAPVTSYNVYNGVTYEVATTSSTSITVPGLTNGQSYHFWVTALNGAGESWGAESNWVLPAGPPHAPSSVEATAGYESAFLNWSSSYSNGSMVTGYTVTASNGATATTEATSIQFHGLTSGATYTFTVRATNSVGDGPESAPSNAVTLPAVPGAPTDVNAVGGDSSATVSWTASPDNGSPVTGYTVTASNGLTAVTSSTSLVFGGLVNGTSYTFTVRATNEHGNSAESAPSNAVTPAGAPFSPSGVGATGGDGSATVSWTAPYDNASPITGYTVTASNGATATTSDTSLVFGGLVNGTSYTFTVRATNDVGDGVESAPSNEVVPAGLPAAPTGATATAGNQSATVSWTAADGNGRPVTGYTVTASNGASATTADTSLVFGGLVNGTSYTFTVRATNSLGDSAESAPSNSVTPATTPDAPTGVAATAGNASARVSWTAPASDGGSPVTLYTVTSSGGTTATTTGTSVVVTGLGNLTPYTFTVRATNVMGDSPESAPSNLVVPLPVPGSPLSVRADGGDSSALVAWAEPESDGAAPVLNYTVTVAGTNQSVTVPGSARRATVTGLMNGQRYTFTVTATNAVGTSPPSDPSNSVKPRRKGRPA